jgi:hypothetical protein
MYIYAFWWGLMVGCGQPEAPASSMRRPASPGGDQQRAAAISQGFTYRTGGPNRRPPVTVYRSVSRGNRRLPSKFKFSNRTPSQSVIDRFTVRLGSVTGQ